MKYFQKFEKMKEILEILFRTILRYFALKSLSAELIK